jgi:hypothetical protein
MDVTESHAFRFLAKAKERIGAIVREKFASGEEPSKPVSLVADFLSRDTTTPARVLPAMKLLKASV